MSEWSRCRETHSKPSLCYHITQPVVARTRSISASRVSHVKTNLNARSTRYLVLIVSMNDAKTASRRQGPMNAIGLPTHVINRVEYGNQSEERGDQSKENRQWINVENQTDAKVSQPIRCNRNRSIRPNCRGDE